MVGLGEEWWWWWGPFKLYLSALPADEKQQHQEETDGGGAADGYQHPNTQPGFCGATQADGSSPGRVGWRWGVQENIEAPVCDIWLEL